jgi:N-acetylglutamate synthase-like GNAT family acetyltransferase
MPYTTRELPVEEWGRLDGLPIGQHRLDPNSAAVLVVEDGGEIIACVGTLTVPHAEEFWIAPAYRGNPVVIVSLLDGCFEMLRNHGLKQVFSVAPTPAIADLLLQLGGIPLGMLYLLPVPDAEEIH